jgi:2-oxoisovalerate dehydrogenase E1 component
MATRGPEMTDWSGLVEVLHLDSRTNVFEMSQQTEKEINTTAKHPMREELLKDFGLICLSREASLLGRKEVLTGKAKFGIFGDGKELAQVALSRYFKPGDWRSGYYRDQTWMMALGLLNVRQYFAGLYADTSLEKEPMSGGRQMNGHFATHSINPDGTWKNLAKQYNSSADISPTAGQMPRLLGLAKASKHFRKDPGLSGFTEFSDKGNEIAFGSIGDASTSEGLFWETMNAASVLGVPLLMSVWDDGFGISVPKKYQTVKESISEAFRGFEISDGTNGIKIFKARGWNYPELILAYQEATAFCREHHIPVLVHVEEVTQPQGHSTSGSHERYKTKEQLEWTAEYDCIEQFRKFIILEGAATAEELDQIRAEAKQQVRNDQKTAWESFRNEIDSEKSSLLTVFEALMAEHPSIGSIVSLLKNDKEPGRKELVVAAREVLFETRGKQSSVRLSLAHWLESYMADMHNRYSSELYAENEFSSIKIEPLAPEYAANPEMADGRVILRDNHEILFQKYPELLIFGEDVGKIGGVNQTMEGMQEKFGSLRVSDTGIREATILGEGIGMAMRGLRPIAEIQYLDYLYYALQIMRDDLATVRYRTKGRQKAPLIVSTRGHRLEGIWHSGSPMGAVIHSVRGMVVCVPRNMTQAAGMYNTLLKSDDPALVVEPLNGYRTKEPVPMNLGEFRIPIGIPEILRSGTDLTLVSYGSTLNIAAKSVEKLAAVGISVELIDARTLLPFDIQCLIGASVKKTNRLLIVDEDVPGGASAYILDQVVNHQGAYQWLDSQPVTLAAKDHLPAYGTDGDYFSKPSKEDIFEAAYAIMSEAFPARFSSLIG